MSGGEQRGPWQVTRKDLKYQNPWIRIDEYRVEDSEGNPGLFGVLSQPPGVSVLPVDHDMHCYLAFEYQFGVNRWMFGTFDGGQGDSPTLIDAAKKELKEEAGIEARVWHDLGFVDPMTTVICSPKQLYLARDLTVGEPQLEDGEHIKVVRMSLNEAVDLVMDSAVTHGPGSVLIMKAAEYLRREGLYSG